jgi:hypothetical protein
MKTRAQVKVGGEAVSESKATTAKTKASEKKKKVAAPLPPGMLSGTRSQGAFSFLNPGYKKKAKTDDIQAKKQEVVDLTDESSEASETEIKVEEIEDDEDEDEEMEDDDDDEDNEDDESEEDEEDDDDKAFIDKNDDSEDDDEEEAEDEDDDDSDDDENVSEDEEEEEEDKDKEEEEKIQQQPATPTKAKLAKKPSKIEQPKVSPTKAKVEPKPTKQPPQVIAKKTTINNKTQATTTSIEGKSAQTVAVARKEKPKKSKAKVQAAAVEEKPVQALEETKVTSATKVKGKKKKQAKVTAAEDLVAEVKPTEEVKGNGKKKKKKQAEMPKDEVKPTEEVKGNGKKKKKKQAEMPKEEVKPTEEVKGNGKKKKKQAKVTAAEDLVAEVKPTEEVKGNGKKKKKKQSEMPKEEVKPVETPKQSFDSVPSPTKKAAADPNRFNRLEKNPVLLYVSAEKYPAHSQRFFDVKTKELWVFQNSKGQSFEKGAFYCIAQEHGNILGARRVQQPDVIEVTPLGDDYFRYVDREKEAGNLVLLGIVTSVEEQRIVPLRHSSTPVAMREYTADFQSASGSRYRIPITVWGVLSNAVHDVGTPILFLNAKQSSYQELPRFSVGDNSAIFVMPFKNAQVKKLCQFLRSSTGDVEPELPEGIRLFVPNEDAAAADVAKEEETQEPAKKKQKIAKAEGKVKKKTKKNTTTA